MLTETRQKIEKVLRSKGLSSTSARRDILNLLMTRHGPFSAKQIMDEIPAKGHDQATIYRCLKSFLAHNLIREVHLGENFSRYEYNRPEHHHHHIMCRECEKIESLEECLIGPYLRQLKKRGFTQIEHKLEFIGICKRCQTKDVKDSML